MKKIDRKERRNYGFDAIVNVAKVLPGCNDHIDHHLETERLFEGMLYFGDAVNTKRSYKISANK